MTAPSAITAANLPLLAARRERQRHLEGARRADQRDAGARHAVAREPVDGAVDQPLDDEVVEAGGHDGNSGVRGSAEVAFDDAEAGGVAHGEREFKRTSPIVDYYVTRREPPLLSYACPCPSSFVRRRTPDERPDRPSGDRARSESCTGTARARVRQRQTSAPDPRGEDRGRSGLRQRDRRYAVVWVWRLAGRRGVGDATGLGGPWISSEILAQIAAVSSTT